MLSAANQQTINVHGQSFSVEVSGVHRRLVVRCQIPRFLSNPSVLSRSRTGGLPREQNLGRALYNSHTPSRSLEYFCIFELADTVRVSIHLKFFISRIFVDRFFDLFFFARGIDFSLFSTNKSTYFHQIVSAGVGTSGVDKNRGSIDDLRGNTSFLPRDTLVASPLHVSLVRTSEFPLRPSKTLDFAA